MDENAVEYVFFAYGNTEQDGHEHELCRSVSPYQTEAELAATYPVVAYPVGELTYDETLMVENRIAHGIDLFNYGYRFIPLNELPRYLPSRLDFEFRKNYFERQEPNCNYGPIVLTRLAIEYADMVRSIRKDTERAGEPPIEETVAPEAATDEPGEVKPVKPKTPNKVDGRGRPPSPRAATFRKLSKEGKGPAEIRDAWNNMSKSERKAIDPKNPSQYEDMDKGREAILGILRRTK